MSYENVFARRHARARLRLPAGYVIDRGTGAGLLLVQERTGSGPVR
jgi:hypothetical protein